MAKKLGSTKSTDNVLVTSANLASEVTGVLPVANGGTGNSVYTNGQLLIGNTTGNTLTKATLTQGTGISITNGAGSITIASTATGDVVGDDTTTTVQNIVAYNSTGGKNITELTGTQGDVLYHNGTNWAKLGAGTAGQVLQTGGAGANPSWVSVSGDPWTIRRLTSDFTTTNSTLTLVSDGTNLMRHRPAANTVTEYQIFLMIQTATATNNPRTAWEWATSLVEGAVQIFQTSSGSGVQAYESGNISAAVQIPAGGLPTGATTWPVRIWAVTVAGGTAPGGFNQVSMAAETAGTTMTVKAGSFMKWRTL
jgi:hypothetical protein